MKHTRYIFSKKVLKNWIVCQHIVSHLLCSHTVKSMRELSGETASGHSNESHSAVLQRGQAFTPGHDHMGPNCMHGLGNN